MNKFEGAFLIVGFSIMDSISPNDENLLSFLNFATP